MKEKWERKEMCEFMKGEEDEDEVKKNKSKKNKRKRSMRRRKKKKKQNETKICSFIGERECTTHLLYC